MAEYEVKILISGSNESAKKALEEINKGLEKTDDGLKKTSEATKETAEKTGDLNEGLGKLAGSFAVVAGSVAFISKGFSEFAKGQTEILGLNQTLKNLGEYSDDVSKSLIDFGNEMSALTGIEDEQIVALMDYGLNLGISSDRIKDATKNAMGLSEALHLDLNQSMKLTSAYLEGNIDKMSKALPILNEMGSDTEKMAFVQQKMNDGLLLSQARMSGAEGSMIKMTKYFGDFQKLIGEVLEPVIKAFIDSMTYVMKIILDASPGVKVLIGVVTSLVIALGTIPPAITLIKTALALLNLNPVMLIISGVLVALTAVIVGFDKLNKSAHSVDALTKSWESAHAATEMHEKQLKSVQDEYDSIKNGTGQQIDLQKQWLLNDIEAIKRTIENNKIEEGIRKKKLDAKKAELGLDKLEEAQTIKKNKVIVESEKTTAEEIVTIHNQLAESIATIKKGMLDAGVRATIEAAAEEGATVAKVMGATLRVIARQIAEILTLKSIAAFSDPLTIPMGFLYAGGAVAVLTAGNAAASAIENNPIKMFAEGGMINEPVYGVGASGARYMFGEAGPEKVTPARGGDTNTNSISIGHVTVKANNAKEFMNGLYEIQRRTNTRMMARA